MFCGINSYNMCSNIALPMIRCSMSAQKSAVEMCQVATVVIETTHTAGCKPT